MVQSFAGDLSKLCWHFTLRRAPVYSLLPLLLSCFFFLFIYFFYLARTSRFSGFVFVCLFCFLVVVVVVVVVFFLNKKRDAARLEKLQLGT